jgi:cytokinin dehydrogenase
MKSTLKEPLLDDAVREMPVHSFDPTGRFWVTIHQNKDHFVPVPNLDGTLITDPAQLSAAADDYGHLISRTPLAILHPGSVDDVVTMMHFARRFQLRIVGRGNGHTAFGQAQVEGGLVIDLGSLHQIHAVTADRAVVDAGVVWRDLLHLTTAQGLTPPVLTDYTALTVGGTLSVGGVSGRSYQYGAQVDNVLELQVVTGEGELLTCSESENRDLFEGVLAGLGQCALIVRATIRLIPACQRARTRRLFYLDVPTMLADMRVLMDDGRFDYIRGNGAPVPADPILPPTGFAFFIEATSFYTTPDELPLNPTSGLRFIPGMEQEEDQTYVEFTDIVVQLIAQLEAAGLGQLPHPWLDLFVADSVIDDFVTQTIAELNPAQFLPGSLLLFYPFVRSRLKRPLFRIPDGERFFLFDILRTVPSDPAVIEGVLAQNRRFYDQNQGLGGCFYTISAVPMQARDWIEHFHPHQRLLKDMKQRHDPAHLLGAGLPLFQ